MSVYKNEGTRFYRTDFIVNGNRIIRSTKKTTKREAEAVERELKEEFRNKASHTRTKDLTLDQIFAKWWIDHASKKASADDIKRHMLKICEHIDANILMRELSNEHIASFVTKRLSEGVSNATVNRALEVLRAAYNRAAKRWEVGVRPIDWAEHLLPETRERVRWITIDDARTLIKLLPDHIALIVEFSLLTGVRRSEAFNLTWAKVDITIGLAEVWSKGGFWRTIYLSDDALALLRSCPKTRRYVFDRTNWRRAFARAKERAGIDDFRWHDLRHTHATWLRQHGAPLEIVQRSLGHTNITTTSRYAHVEDTEVRAAVQKLTPVGHTSANRVHAFPNKFKGIR